MLVKIKTTGNGFVDELLECCELLDCFNIRSLVVEVIVKPYLEARIALSDVPCLVWFYLVIFRLDGCILLRAVIAQWLNLAFLLSCVRINDEPHGVSMHVINGEPASV